MNKGQGQGREQDSRRGSNRGGQRRRREKGKWRQGGGGGGGGPVGPPGSGVCPGPGGRAAREHPPVRHPPPQPVLLPVRAHQVRVVAVRRGHVDATLPQVCGRDEELAPPQGPVGRLLADDAADGGDGSLDLVVEVRGVVDEGQPGVRPPC
eukprot:766937-Hanusia_phi.AAC.1